MLALTADRTVGPYLRGRLHMAGVRAHTDLGTALDVLDVAVVEAPVDSLEKRRRRLDVAVAIAQARTGVVDRDTWGTDAAQQAETSRLMSEGPGG